MFKAEETHTSTINISPSEGRLEITNDWLTSARKNFCGEAMWIDLHGFV